jgi:hypothetical protein
VLLEHPQLKPYSDFIPLFNIIVHYGNDNTNLMGAISIVLPRALTRWDGWRLAAVQDEILRHEGLGTMVCADRLVR